MSLEPALQKHRAAVTLGSAGLGVVAVLAGGVLVAAGTTASAAGTCAATTSTATPTATTTATGTSSPTPSASPSDGGILGGILGGGSATPTASGSATATSSATSTATATATSTATSTASPTATASPTSGGILPFPFGGGQGTETASPGASSSATATPTATATSTATATPTATSTGSPSPATTIAVNPRRIQRSEHATVIVHSGPGCLVTLYAATRPSTSYRAAHTATTDQNGYTGFVIAPASNTSLYATSESGSTSPKTSVNVRYRISLRVTRVGVRTMRFDGGVTPGGGGTTVDVYRSSGSGPVKVGTTRTASNGGYSLTAALPAGKYTFYALVATTVNNDGNRSPYVQATVS